MKKNIILSFLIFLSLILFFLLKNKSTKNSYQNYKHINQNIVWYFSNKKIEFHYKKPPKGEEDNTLIFTVDEGNTKDLFYRLDYNVIKIEPLNFTNKNIFLLANRFYEAGGYTLYFAAILDLDNKKIIYKTGNLVKKGTFSFLEILNNGNIKISTLYPRYDYCRSCAFEMLDFLRYQDGKFISVNTLYKEEFERIYKTIKKEDGCYVLPGEKRLTFEQIKEQLGEDYQCRASEKSLPEFRGATPKEYFLLREKIEKIISGQEVRVFDVSKN